MSKVIRLTQELIEEAKAKFEELLNTGKFTDGKISYTYNLSNIDRKANLIFSEVAWLKMQSLVREFSTEIAWHGVVYRGEEGTDDYIVKDILVYPQIVASATVDGDQEKMFEWLNSLDDEVFCNMKMHGHSHVNMGVTPSATDLNHYNNEILSELNETSFYVFVIWNKKNERTIKIYDYGKNLFFDTSDVNVQILDEGFGIETFIEDAKSKLKEKTYTASATTYTYNTPAAQKTVAQSTTKSDTKQYSRKETKKTASMSGFSYSYYDDDDDDWNPDYSYYGYSRKGW